MLNFALSLMWQSYLTPGEQWWKNLWRVTQFSARQILCPCFNRVLNILGKLQNIEWVVKFLNLLQTQIKVTYHLQQSLHLLLLIHINQAEKKSLK